MDNKSFIGAGCRLGKLPTTLGIGLWTLYRCVYSSQPPGKTWVARSAAIVHLTTTTAAF